VSLKVHLTYNVEYIVAGRVSDKQRQAAGHRIYRGFAGRQTIQMRAISSSGLRAGLLALMRE